ncbi:MBL fold metallo-hydrolase [Isachenkonia alkalipeptolytica]|uniref:MBL fold metallo-hydrolase n=1 Tax=Isachenkonia alkalipeptolytica TaxID=2565777 RepID=A0AA43XKP9_9CLOT|nr:MBL fold metallo-hydrolase [Isachenkonia alkalipeptolytica]NBG88101.1 MBL fold metallo-hydrolase [Isachenkonia alkalipeptolytica]
MIRFCSLVSGSAGNSYAFSDGEQRFLVDAGLSGKQIENRLAEIDIDPESLSGILISHEHIDHIKGAGILSRRYDLPVYANQGTWQAMEDKIGKIAEKNRRTFQTNEIFSMGKLTIKPYKTSHDAAESVGFTVSGGREKVSIATDIGCMTPEILEEIKGSDLVVLEANHDVEVLKSGRYPYSLKRRILSDQGHLSNEAAGDCICYLAENKVENFVLAHLSEENNFPELALSTIQGMLSERQRTKHLKINVDIAFRNRIGRVYEFNKS